MKLYYFLAFSFFILSCTSNKKDINISKYGAKGDSLTINTEFIQKAIDECFENGGGTVVVSDGIYITGTILLKDNVTLQVNENATLFGSSNFADYINIDSFIDATGQARGFTWGLCHFVNAGTPKKGYSIMARFDCDLSLDYHEPLMKKTGVWHKPEVYFAQGMGSIGKNPEGR